ncbi:DUF4229 domain-containing protein [Mycolicibacterium aichiense]|uniref:DUF4229 domain-containing protein n=1 Tax=Mycolicibacterium aichiense TaxID=1799 RepID=A0AAD1MDW8_9MYCO|nr:DUF4229 domain-containing protein [Mycolicibacterium aichiense]MCV7016197.1 DUF4229 domain-containing protein [Mycolicibacterium aichiense]BBX10038.1 hypothetical protein MAIC_48410 [Mycolicibacterium aichiense]STZ26297.1 Conserved membrane protein of uncharacterised function [Mycolicibacterium aichiense]
MSDNSDNKTSGAGGRLALDVLLYTLARIALVVVLTAAIYYLGKLIGITEFPLIVALLFGIVLALPLGIWLLAPLRKRATASIAAVDERRRRDREQLQARLRGKKSTD